MRVAIYARVSSESQEARGTIGSQLEVLRARIRSEGHELVAEFCDDGYSGARLDRPGLDMLRDQAEAGAFEAVWWPSPDRPARLEIFEPEAAVVRRIFEDYVNGGLSIRRIVRGLNTDQVPTPAGKAEWWHSTVCRVLRNEAYVGRLYFNQTETVPRAGPGSRRATRQRRRPREEWITIPCPAIIDEAMFDAA